ncbi:MAG: efflux RND transporter periplasmic adaptor subunit [Bacteroidales bacterium]|nr:efflux RND transporter periplasmic adaptor subunit [Bacteroidales bacterium]
MHKTLYFLLSACLMVAVAACSHHHDEHEHEHEGHEHEHEHCHNHELLEAHPNAITFTQEQAKQVDFAVAQPELRPIGQTIPTTAQVQSAVGDQMTVVAKSNGIVNFTTASILEGQTVSSGAALFNIAADGLVDDNLTVRLQEAQNNFETAKQNYERAKTLVDSKIVSQKEFSEIQNIYKNAKIAYENLQKNVSGNGSKVTAPMSGYITQLLVPNGAYVTVGQPLMVISQNRSIVLKADVSQRYAHLLPSLTDANIENPLTHEVCSLKEMNGRILSYGKSTSAESHMLPVTLEISNSGSFTTGSFVKVWLNTQGSQSVVAVPKTALLEEQGNYFVFKQISTELFEKQPVTIGASDGKFVEIVSGVSSDDNIVTRGAVMVKLAKASGALDPHAGHVH